jgi:hypothetical protein
MRRLSRWLSVTTAVLLAACGGPDFRPPEAAPGEWRQAMAEEAPGGWVVWGYGTAGASDSLAAARAKAASRARGNLAERLTPRIQYLREGLVEALAGEGSKELEKTDIQAVVKRASEIAVNGATVERRQRDAQGMWHALARAELRPALREAANNRGLSGSARERLMDEADRLLKGADSQGSQ